MIFRLKPWESLGPLKEREEEFIVIDTVDKKTRSETMAKVKSKDTGPELRFRHLMFARGLRYRLHEKNLPGNPDLIFPRYRVVIFVHGCLWHWHGCSRSRMPATNVAYWERKISRNRERDSENIKRLMSLGWRVLIVWECALKKSNVGIAVDEAIAWLREGKNNFHEIGREYIQTEIQ